VTAGERPSDMRGSGIGPPWVAAVLRGRRPAGVRPLGVRPLGVRPGERLALVLRRRGGT